MSDNFNLQKIANILRTDRRTLQKLQDSFEKATGKDGMIQKIVEENEMLIRNRLDILGLGRNVSASEVYDSLISKVESDDLKLFEALGSPNMTKPADIQRVIDLAIKISDNRTGFFLKKEVAVSLLKNEPPRHILEALGYRSVEEMLAAEDLFEVYSALRFLEDTDWLNNVFFRQYENLTPADFEEREVIGRALDAKWLRAAENFLKKKYHNVSHLKELGVIFVLPVSLGVSGETLRLLSLLAHYFSEIYFYSELFRDAVKYGKDFSNRLISFLRGDVIDERPPVAPGDGGKSRLLIIQRYLAKDDENDWRLFEPHINPEAVHWRRAEERVVQAGKILPALADNLMFWKDLDWVGDYFKDEVGKDVLVSFNLVDTVMALVMEKEMIKYLYHHQESLWNKIYIVYYSEEKLMDMVKKNIIKGWFEM